MLRGMAPRHILQLLVYTNAFLIGEVGHRARHSTRVDVASAHHVHWPAGAREHGISPSLIDPG
jgi:hypothetical protein